MNENCLMSCRMPLKPLFTAFLFAFNLSLKSVGAKSGSLTTNRSNFNFNQPTNIENRTPCCVDRLTSLTCGRMMMNGAKRFFKRCATDPDFALIQCCSTCFDKRNENSQLNYNLLVRRYLEDPMKSTCIDRRGGDWCQKMIKWEDSTYSHTMKCGAFPSAFRECRNTCGYCSATMQMTVVKYDYRLATSSKRCDIKTYFARTDSEMRKKQPMAKEFDPLARLTWKRPRDSDYFVVQNHDYDEFI